MSNIFTEQCYVMIQQHYYNVSHNNIIDKLV